MSLTRSNSTPSTEPRSRSTSVQASANFSREEAELILRNLGSQLQTGDALLLGTDMVKDEPTLLAAYDDTDGITAAFNLNILHRLNRELGANFDAASSCALEFHRVSDRDAS
jgi:uncharacterized SAM-dependent methyltransferase